MKSLSLLALCLFCFFSAQAEEPFPHYQIDVQFQSDKKLLSGKVQVHIPEKYHSAQELWFALPMNRFLASDSRGSRKIYSPPVFALNDFGAIHDDPLFPEGFQNGALLVHKVTTLKGRPLVYEITDNPDIPVGYSVQRGLLKLKVPKDLPESSIIIYFETRLPLRFLDGVTDETLVAIDWHPILLEQQNQKWKTNQFEASPATYDVRWTSSTPGTLITTTATHTFNADTTTKKAANFSVRLPRPRMPIKYFPLVFSPNYQKLPGMGDVDSFYFPKQIRRAALMQKWGQEFLDFVSEHYKLELPWRKLRIVSVPGKREQVWVFNNLVLMTTPHYERSNFLDRRVLGFLTRNIGELWFGESVWNNRDRQLWLNMGISAFLNLKFFSYKFGNDAGIFDFIDWINPHYREHFFESMFRNMRQELQIPIISSLHETSSYRNYLILVTYKSALVISMLEYLIGEERFQKGFSDFYRNNRYRFATLSDFQKSFNTQTQEALDWFFEQWFHTTKTLDYELGEITRKILPDGRYETQVNIRKLEKARMPVEVILTTDAKEVLRKRTLGNDGDETLTFVHRGEPDQISLDPDERLMETFRINNHASPFFRVRFAFDWKKAREHFITLIPAATSNAFDGNSFGIGLRYQFGNYKMQVIPGYGSKNKQLLYAIEIVRDHWLWKGTQGALRFTKTGGVRSEGITLSYASPTYREELHYQVSSSLDRELLFKAHDGQATAGVNESGRSNILGLAWNAGFSSQNNYAMTWNVNMQQPLHDLGTDFQYTLWDTTVQPILNLGFRKRFIWRLFAGTTFGDSPLQKKFQLGGPQQLRGFPQHIKLRNDQILISRMDFSFPLVTLNWWGDISSLGILGSVFYDQGKTWSLSSYYSEARMHKNAGFGIEWSFDAVSLAQIPIKLEVAYPLGDPDYDKPIFTLLGTLSGS